MADPRPTALSLFSGVGGLDLGWELVTGGRVVGYSERDAYAAAVLLARMEDASLEPAPVWCGDIADLDVAPFHGVDYVIGGFPCQDISTAGKGVGIEGARSGLWSELLRAYRDSGARCLFAENVSAVTFRGLDRVLHDLAEVGCAAEWLCVRASDVGAPHRRERWFLLAERVPNPYSDPLRHEPGRRGGPDGAGAAESGHDGAGNVADRSRGGFGEYGGAPGGAGYPHQRDQILAASDSGRREGQRRGGLFDGCGAGLGHAASEVERSIDGTTWDQQKARPCEGGAGMGSADGERPQGRRGDDGEHAGELPAWPPSPGGDWSGVPEHLAPAIKPGFRCVVDGASVVVDQSRADQLRCLGNGVVALQAAVALHELHRRMSA